MENKHSLAEQLNVHVCHDHEDEEEDTCPVCGHHHDHGHEHHHEHDDCEHHHEHDECEHHHEHCECDHDHHHEHEHEHEHNHEHCDCHHEHHHDHHHHHADEVFTSWGKETLQQYSEADMKSILTALENSEVYGFILRAKGIVKANNDQWIHFDYVPGEPDVRFGTPSNIGKICVIGSHIHEDAIQALFDGIKE